MKVSIRDRLEAVGAPAWDGLVAASRLRSPFLSWAWQSEWARTFAADRRLEIRCVEDGGGNLVGILPLYETPSGSLELIGGADVSDYLDLISVHGREEEAWMALLQSRTAERAQWELHAVPETSPTVASLPPLAAACGLAASATVEERCPVLNSVASPTCGSAPGRSPKRCSTASSGCRRSTSRRTTTPTGCARPGSTR